MALVYEDKWVSVAVELGNPKYFVEVFLSEEQKKEIKKMGCINDKNLVIGRPLLPIQDMIDWLVEMTGFWGEDEREDWSSEEYYIYYQYETYSDGLNNSLSEYQDCWLILGKNSPYARIEVGDSFVIETRGDWQKVKEFIEKSYQTVNNVLMSMIGNYE